MIGYRSIALAAAACISACQSENHDLVSVVVSLPEQSASNVAKATILVDYTGTEARIASEGGSPACAFILPGIDGDFADDHKGTLTIHTRGARALRGPADFVACQMHAPDGATPPVLHDKLTVRVASAEDATGKAIDVSAKSPHGHAPSADRSEAAIEAAQASAVKAAAAIATTPSASPTAPVTGGAIVAAPGAPAAPVASAVPLPGAIPRPQATPAPTASASVPNRVAPAASKPLVAGPTSSSGGNAAGADMGGSAAVNDASSGNGGVPSGDEGDPGYDDSCPSSWRAYTLEIAVNQSSAPRLGALQLEVTHLGRAGCFIGPGDTVDCVPLVDALVAANYPGERTAKIGLISLQGIPTPAAVMRCGFKTKEALSPASFLVQVMDASTPAGDPVDPPPSVAVTVTGR